MSRKKRAKAGCETICQPAVKTSTINKGVIHDGCVGRLAGETGGRNGRFIGNIEPGTYINYSCYVIGPVTGFGRLRKSSGRIQKGYYGS